MHPIYSKSLLVLSMRMLSSIFASPEWTLRWLHHLREGLLPCTKHPSSPSHLGWTAMYTPLAGLSSDGKAFVLTARGTWPGASVKLYACKSRIRVTLISMMAKFCPMQARMPSPNVLMLPRLIAGVPALSRNRSCMPADLPSEVSAVAWRCT